MQKLKSFYIVGGIGAAILENSLAVSQNVKVAYMTKKFHSQVLKRKENIQLCKHMHTDVHSNVIHGGQGKKQPKCPATSKWMNKGRDMHTEDRKGWGTATL